MLFVTIKMWKQALLAAGAAGATTESIQIESATANTNSVPGQSFISYSIELSSFPDFAGNKSNPNTFTDNLLTNIGDIIGSKPYIRVGGNTQDYALTTRPPSTSAPPSSSRTRRSRESSSRTAST
ncbi:hypothetical protein NLG97_g6720 [Lecanicillium saksenae]|uniref:Uncharacterized protein n=1 Tax=Lecanicillium saksenae TaxID=468837 RepID=A0ACC1QNZ4_9HYPO|nr:hypothetical protein NLG97_g6720 [Lecanicillium saksenae]